MERYKLIMGAGGVIAVIALIVGAMFDQNAPVKAARYRGALLMLATAFWGYGFGYQTGRQVGLNESQSGSPSEGSSQ